MQCKAGVESAAQDNQKELSIAEIHHAIRILGTFIWNTHLKRALEEVDPDPKLNFWRIIYGTQLDMAVIEWCKLFGSDHEEHQPVHWKNTIPEKERDQFRNDLFKHLKLTPEKFREYWETVKNYRDNHAAHFNSEWLKPENKPKYPTLDVALEASYFYYPYLLNEFKKRGIEHHYPLDIREYSERFSKQAIEVAAKAISATADIKEKVR